VAGKRRSRLAIPSQNTRTPNCFHKADGKTSSSNERKVRHAPSRKRTAGQLRQSLHDQQLLEELDSKWSVGVAHIPSAQRHEQHTERSNEPISAGDDHLESSVATEGKLNRSLNVARFAVLHRRLTPKQCVTTSLTANNQEKTRDQGSKYLPHYLSDENVIPSGSEHM
jgi:hypothetical protein